MNKLDTVIWFPVFLSKTNNLQVIIRFHVTNNNYPELHLQVNLAQYN